MTNEFVDKTTSLKTVERISFEAIPFAKGYKVKVKVAFNPEDTMHLDQLLADDPQQSAILMALDGFTKNVIEKQLGGKLIKDE